MAKPYVFGRATTKSDAHYASLENSNLAAASAMYHSRNSFNPQVDSADNYRHNMPANTKHGVTHPSRSHDAHRYRNESHNQRQHSANNTSEPAPRPQNRIPNNVVTDLLPYCTTGPPLSQEQVIALSDIAGSLKELVLLTRGAAAGLPGCEEKLVGAMGAETARNILAFFADEWELE